MGNEASSVELAMVMSNKREWNNIVLLKKKKEYC